MKHERIPRPRLSVGIVAQRVIWLAETWRFPGYPFWITVGLGLLALLPILSLTFVPTPPEVWQQISPQLPLLVSNSLWLAAEVALASGLLGVALAWLTELYDFPGRRFFAAALLLPLAIPAYVQGFVVIHLYAPEPAHRFWQSDAPWLPSGVSGGLILSLSLALYPYVYLAARQGFRAQSGQAMEVARSLGAGPIRAFFRAGLPVALPWIGIGMAAVALETLADLGTVSLFRYETFTTALYRAWPSPLPTAERLAGLLLILAAGFMFLTHHQAWRLRLYQSFGNRPTRPALLPGLPGKCASACAGLALGTAFVIPLGQLLVWGFAGTGNPWDGGLAQAVLPSLWTALAGAGLITAAGLTVSFAKRHYPGTGFAWLVRAATLGLLLPGAVWAAGIVSLESILDDGLSRCCQAHFKLADPSMLGSGISVLLLAYLVRFVGPAVSLTDGAMGRITPSMTETARGLGVSGPAIWRQVYVPLLWQDVLGAFLLVFAALLQELPITLLLRPIGFESLPTRLFAMNAQGHWEKAALPALVLVLAGLPAAYGLIRARAFRHV